MKVLAFAASNSTQSINKQLVVHAADLLRDTVNSDAQSQVLDLNDFEMPIYSADREQGEGIPQPAHRFFNAIGAADALLISFAEHNGNYSAAYKNLFDWASRIDSKVYQNKPAVLLSTSPGKGGAASVMKMALESAPFFAMDVRAHLSIASFHEVFRDGVLIDTALQGELQSVLKQLSASA